MSPTRSTPQRFRNGVSLVSQATPCDGVGSPCASPGSTLELRSGLVVVSEEIGVRSHHWRHDLGVEFAGEQPGPHAAQVLRRIDQADAGQAFGIADRTVGARVAFHADASMRLD